MQVTIDSMSAALQALVDRSEITDLVARLGMCLDEGRFDDLRGLFVEDATVRTPGGTAVGRDALVAQAARNHRADVGIQHVTTNVLIEPDGDGDRAAVRANLVVRFTAPVGATAPPPSSALAPPVRFGLGEVYRFEVVRTAQGWRFASVETHPVWTAGSLDDAATRGPDGDADLPDAG
jgi:hypothetical protein